MATNFPTSLDNLSNPAGSDPVNNPSHAVQHANVNDAIEALETKVGVNNSAVTTSLDYRVKQLETNPTYTNEMAQDAVAAALAAGTHTNITINYNDTGNSISISAAAGYTNEEAVDAVAAALTAGSGISISYNDPANTITISVDSTIATKTYVDTAITSLGNTAATTYVPQSDVGNIDGVASLDGTGKVPDSQIPAGIARDSEVTSAISTEVTNRNSAISTAINNLINSAPGTLDTLGEIATQLAADESAAAALTTVVNGKVSKAGGDVITSSLPSVIGLTIKGSTSQTANLQEWQTGAGTVGVYVNGSGQLETGYFYTNFGGGSYKNNGLVTINPANNIVPLVIAGASGQTSNLTEWKNNSGTVLAKVTSTGMLDITPLSGSTISFRNSSGGLTFWGGNSSYYMNTGLYITGGSWADGRLGVDTLGASSKGIVVRGAANQSANLQEWQTSSGTVLASIQANGQFNLGAGAYVDIYGEIISPTTVYSNNVVHNYGRWAIGNNGTAHFDTNDAAASPLILKGAAGQTANLQEWQNSSGTTLAYINSEGSIYSANRIVAPGDTELRGNTFFGNPSFNVGTLNISTRSADRTGITIRAAASQTANLQEWQNSTGTVLASISPTGKLTSAVDASINGMTIGLGSGSISSNTAIGISALGSNTTGSGNTALGAYAGTTNASTVDNTYIGKNAGYYSYGNYNVFIGSGAAFNGGSGSNNTYIGTSTGTGNNYSGCVFIGYNAGQNTTGNNQLVIANTNTATPLIGGDFSAKTLTVAGNATITSQATGTVGLVVKGVASQTADLQQWQDSSGNVLAKIDLNGRMTADHFKASVLWNNVIVNYGDNGPYFNMTSTNVLLQNRNTTSNVLFTIKGMASQTGNLQEWQRSDGFTLLSVSKDGDVTAGSGSSTAIRFRYFDGINISGTYWDTVATNSATFIGRSTTAATMVIKGAASQTANLQEWQNSAGTVLAKVDSTGAMFTITPADSTNNTQVATTAYVKSNINNLINSAPGALDTLNELAAALGNDANFSTTITNSLALKAPLASPTFTGTPLAPTATSGTNTTQIATTAFVKTAIDSSVQPGALYQTSAPTSPAVGQIWIDSDDDVTVFDSNIIRRKSFTATAGQTAFVTDIPFIDGFEQVFMNGLLLVKTTDYTVSGGNTVTLVSGAAVSDIIEVVSVTGANSVTTYTQAEVDTLIANNKAVSPQAISANTTLVKKKRYYVTSGSPLTLTLPASPTLDDEIQIVDASGNASTYNITVARNDSLINGGAVNLIIDTNGGWYTLIYTGSTYGWKVG